MVRERRIQDISTTLSVFSEVSLAGSLCISVK